MISLAYLTPLTSPLVVNLEMKSINKMLVAYVRLLWSTMCPLIDS